MTVPVPTGITALTWFTLAQGTQGEVISPPPLEPPTTFVNNMSVMPVAYALPLYPVYGQKQSFKDAGGNAAVHPITVYDPNGRLIDNRPQFVINVNFAALTFEWNGVGWSVT